MNSAHQNCHHEVEPFTRPIHFVLALLPVELGVAYFFMKLASTPAAASLENLMQGPTRTVWIQDTSAGYHLFFFGLFVAVMVTGMGLMKMVNRLEHCE